MSQSTAPALAPMRPTVARVRDYRPETHDAFTLTLDPPADCRPPAAFRPGQFNMLYAFGVGESAVSISGDPADPALAHTIRAVGPVTNALARLRPGDAVGVRGPFGSAWPLEEARGHDLVLVCGGLGLPPLRPVIYHALGRRADYGRIVLLYGARTPADIVFREELERWARQDGFQVLVTVDRGEPGWRGPVKLVTALFPQAAFDPARAVGLTCGPEVMMRFAVREFHKLGVPDERLYLSLERNMQCAVGMCGHCQLGPSFVCMNGPVFRHDHIRPFLEVREA